MSRTESSSNKPGTSDKREEMDEATHQFPPGAAASSHRWNTEEPISFRNPKVLKNDLLLHEAVIKNDTEVAKEILKEPVDVNSRNNYGRAPIHWAASRGNAEIIEMLISANCDIEAKDKYGMRPLLMAAWHGHKDVVQQLINSGANVQASNKKGYGLLTCAARNNRLSVLNFLLETLEDVDIDVLDNDNQTPLFHAAANGHQSVVERLLSAGAKIDANNKENESPLHAACQKGHVEVVQLLLEQTPHRQQIIQQKDEEGNTPLHVATENCQTTIVQMLLANGASVNATNAKGYTPLHLASNLGCQGILETLLEAGSSLTARSKNGNMPLHLACLSNQLDIVNRLIVKGADVNALNARMQSPIHIAAELGHTEICRVLLEKGANIDQKEQSGKTPLYIAARGSFTAIVDMIIKTTRLDMNTDTSSQMASGNSGRLNHTSRSHPDDTEGPSSGCWDDQHHQQEKMREVLWRLAYKHLGPGEWKKLAFYWKFTDEQIKAIEHQYTGPSSYKEHGFRMLLIWHSGLPQDCHPVKELYESLLAVDKMNVAETLRKKMDEQYKKQKICSNFCDVCCIL